MEIQEHLTSLIEAGNALAAAAEQAGPGASVPTCPGWQIRQLLRHTGMVHRWATAYLVEGHTSYHPDGGEPELDEGELLDWFREGHGLLVRALQSAPADLDCWSFLPAPSPLAFWARRQSHETTIHRVDAESARGGPLSPVTPVHAMDGIDELLCGLHSRPKSRVRSDSPRTLRVRATDTDAAWTVRISAQPPQARRDTGTPAVEDDSADCELSGTAEELYLTLWNRLPLTAITVTGDPAVARLWSETSGITWS
ncbi:maleylpyruvate isomerase family mycothiol-dependent enzyme [Streptomyces sp. NPDC052052]|uniref:maleylpyruvate isomerase family mycothiol-dependent enzyme n=1 Tax=Streptomyces sp. NPDC052052 TaxID=3154756 RepID=UPI00343C090C